MKTTDNFYYAILIATAVGVTIFTAIVTTMREDIFGQTAAVTTAVPPMTNTIETFALHLQQNEQFVTLWLLSLLGREIHQHVACN